MILKSFELAKIKQNNYKFYLFYGDNEGLKEVSKHVFNVKLETIFHKPLLGDSAGVFGAAYLT